MTKAVWFLAGALLISGAARAADEPASPSMPEFDRSVGGHVMPALPANPGDNPELTVNPMGPSAKPADSPHLQSPDALACANTLGSNTPQARVSACGKLIDSHKWKGKEIGWAYANRCQAYDKLGQQDRAMADCSEAISQNPDLGQAFVLRGGIYAARNLNDKALADYDKAAALGVKNPLLYASRGGLLLAKGEADKALADFDQETAVAGGSALSWLDHGSARLGLGDFAGGEQDFAKATDLDPKNGLAWFNRGAAALGAGDKDKAIASLDAAIKLDASNAYAALWRFVARDGSDQAKTELQAFADKAPKNDWPFPVTKLYLGGADVAQIVGAAKGANQECEARFYVAQYHLLKGAKDEAATNLKRAVETCPKSFIEYFRAVAQLKGMEAAK